MVRNWWLVKVQNAEPAVQALQGNQKSALEELCEVLHHVGKIKHNLAFHFTVNYSYSPILLTGCLLLPPLVSLSGLREI